MGRLAGFRYRQIIKRLKAFGFEFDRQAAGSHEIWYNSQTDRYTTILNHSGDLPEGTLRAILKENAAYRERISEIEQRGRIYYKTLDFKKKARADQTEAEM